MEPRNPVPLDPVEGEHRCECQVRRRSANGWWSSQCYRRATVQTRGRTVRYLCTQHAAVVRRGGHVLLLPGAFVTTSGIVVEDRER